ncbi:hypothetical protein J3R83DRAFT_10256 [Lanmaoa asiatica]|nr:hypothetical protein J3R83DRAFT_10256 [Lanmaoa asiatica]
MFHFHFDLEDSVDEATFTSGVPPTDERHDVTSTPQQTGDPFSEIDLESLVRTAYSLTPCLHPHSLGSSLARSTTDPDILLDHFYSVTRWSQSRPEASHAEICLMLAFSLSPTELMTHHPRVKRLGLTPVSPQHFGLSTNASDLVPFVYEGGLKTWECSLDLAGCLRHDGHAANVKGRRLLEVPCHIMNDTSSPLLTRMIYIARVRDGDPDDLHSSGNILITASR